MLEGNVGHTNTFIMKKQFKRALSALVLFIACLTGSYAQTENSQKVDFSHWGVHYTADFDYIDQGTYGASVHSLKNNKIGFSVNILSTNLYIVDFNSTAFSFKGGPNYSYTLSDDVCFYIPLQLNVLNQSYPTYKYVSTGGYSSIEEGETEEKWYWGFDLTPTLAFKFGRVILSAGMQFRWLNGASKIGTAGMISIGRTIF